MRQYYLSHKNPINIKDLSIYLQTFSEPSSSSEDQELSNPIEFINKLSKSQAVGLRTQIYKRKKFGFTINPKNLDDEITPEELITFISVTPEDGK
jgi:hypothetical protein